MVSQNNDGNYYEIAVDTAKEGAEVWSLNDWFKARVGDEGTPLVMRFYTQGQLNSFDGHQKPIIQGNVGAYSFDENKQIVMAADAKVVSWTGDPSDMLPGGRVRYHFPQQMFPTEGVFYGFVGYVDESNGRRLTGVNVWFKVLPGVAQMGRACDFYINDLDVALANAKEKMRQAGIDFKAATDSALQDLRTKYQQEVQANKDASETTRAGLLKLADSVGAIQAQIDAGNVVTRKDFAEGLDKVSGEIASRLAKMDNGVHAFATAQTIKDKYPTGADGIFIAVDTGHQWYWVDGAWKDAGSYQAYGESKKDIAFFPSRDGLPNFDSKEEILDFKCLNDQAMISYSEGYVIFPKNSKLNIAFPENMTVILICINVDTGDISIEEPYKKLSSKQVILASVRKIGTKLIWSGILAQTLLIDGKRYTQSVVYQPSGKFDMSFSDEVGLDFGITDSSPLPYFYSEGLDPVTIVPGTKAVFDSRMDGKSYSYKVTLVPGTTNAVLTPWGMENLPGYITLFNISLDSKTNPRSIKASTGETILIKGTNRTNDVRFTPSADGFPYVDYKRRILNFNCLYDRAFIDYNGKAYQFPTDATVSVDYGGSTALEVLYDLTTSQLEVQPGYNKQTFTPGKVKICKIRKMKNGKVAVEGIKTFDDENANNSCGVKLIAHRGLNTIAPEESLESYSLAIRAGYQDLEADIKFTNDDIPVLHHDDTINRVARNADGTEITDEVTISKKALDELNSYDYGISKSKVFEGVKLLTFEDFVKFGKMTGATLHVEIPENCTESQCDKLLELTKKFRMDKKIAWQCFNHDLLNYVAQLDEDVQLEFLSSSLSEALITEAKEFLNGKRNVVLSVHDFSEDLIDAARSEGLKTYYWTANSADASFLKRLSINFDAIMTNGEIDSSLIKSIY